MIEEIKARKKGEKRMEKRNGKDVEIEHVEVIEFESGHIAVKELITEIVEDPKGGKK